MADKSEAVGMLEQELRVLKSLAFPRMERLEELEAVLAQVRACPVRAQVTGLIARWTLAVQLQARDTPAL